MPFAVTEIWRDSEYYLDTDNVYWPKYLLIMADAGSGDFITAVFTSKPNGLSENPACSQGHPRAGYFVGAPGEPLVLPSWVDFSQVKMRDDLDIRAHQTSGRVTPTHSQLPPDIFCGVLRCVIGCDDLANKYRRLIQDEIGRQHCP